MDYEVRTEDGRTVVSVRTDKPLTHCLIDCGDVPVQELQQVHVRANKWLKDGGVLVVGSREGRPVRVHFPGQFVIEERCDHIGYRIEGPSLEAVQQGLELLTKKTTVSFSYPEPDTIVDGSRR